MEFWKFMFIPTILFLTIVAPMWIALHYHSVRRSSRSLSKEDRKSIDHMLDTVDRLTERIANLEAILDDDHPQWRTQVERDPVERDPTERGPTERGPNKSTVSGGSDVAGA